MIPARLIPERLISVTKLACVVPASTRHQHLRSHTATTPPRHPHGEVPGHGHRPPPVPTALSRAPRDSALGRKGPKGGRPSRRAGARSPPPFSRLGERGWASTNPAVVAGFEEWARPPARPKNSRKGPGRPTARAGFWVAASATARFPRLRSNLRGSVLRRPPRLYTPCLRPRGLGTERTPQC